MPYDDTTLKRDGSGITPVPQHFNPTINDYEPIYGRNNAGRVEIYGPDGNPISTDDSNKLAVRASEIETILNEIKSKDFATQTTAAAILAKIIAAPATEAKQDTLIGHVDGVESALASILAKLIAAPSTEAKQDALAALIGEVDADPTANSLLARLKSLEDKIDAIIDGSSPAVTQLSGSNFEEVRKNVNIITTKHKQAAAYDIYGAKWDKSPSPTLARTDDAVGLTANAGVGYQSVVNDFDKLPIFGEIEEVEDSLGNKFMKIPKSYCRDTDGANHKQIQISKRRYSGFYLPHLFWDFANKKELNYALVGKHKASLGASNKLESKPNQYPLTGKTIVDFRTYAKNNNIDGLLGYQQNDIHWINLLRKLMIIEFATLNIQSVMQGYTGGQYTTTHLATVTEPNANRIIVANAYADLYRVGQTISVGTSQGGNQVFYGRTITAIDVYDASNKAISFDGLPVTITTGNFLYNSGWKTGFSDNILASSGSLIANDGKYPCVYRGIESPFGDVYEFIDGVNITDNQAWVCKNAADFASNVFASPYEKLNYINANADGYTKTMGFDPICPFAEFPTVSAGGSAETYYSDYYYQTTGQRVALFGGSWTDGSSAGLSRWCLHGSSSRTGVSLGGRLLKKPL